jgi:hypothetical protein
MNNPETLAKLVKSHRTRTNKITTQKTIKMSNMEHTINKLWVSPGAQ